MNPSDRIPHVYFHISYSFHKWFLYHRGDFDPLNLESLKKKVSHFETVWASHEEKVLTTLPYYMGVQFPFTEIHVYCFENADYYPVPCISDPVSINMTGDHLTLHVLYLIHELVHVIMQFDTRFSLLSLETQEAIAYVVGNKTLVDILGEKASPIIEKFTIPWPYDFPRISKKYKKIPVGKTTILELVEKGIL
jgi:hypothetical protein